MTRVPQRRKASDLFRRGAPLVLEDGETDLVEDEDEKGQPIIDPDTGEPKMIEVPLPPVTLWVAKLSSPEMNTAMKYAVKAQSVAMAGKRDHDSETWQALRATLANLEREMWEKLIVDDAMKDRYELVQARVQHATVLDDGGEEQPGEWAKDGYLEGLFTAWKEELQFAFAADPEDADAVRVLAEIDRFNAEVIKEYEFELEVEHQNLKPWDDDIILDRATAILIESEGAEAWSDEYVKRIVFLTARECDGPDPRRPGKCLCRGSRAKHIESHFESYDEVVHCDDGTRARIYAAYNQVQVEPAEGKGSPAKPASSAPSVLLATAADSSSSSPAT